MFKNRGGNILSGNFPGGGGGHYPGENFWGGNFLDVNFP